MLALRVGGKSVGRTDVSASDVGDHRVICDVYDDEKLVVILRVDRRFEDTDRGIEQSTLTRR
jgi:mRNA-degrading endonuclease RelE of RelBE toxin-antitoxin system